MSDVHAISRRLPTDQQLCQWRHDWEDVTLVCRDPRLPGERYCVDHYIETVGDH